MWRNGLIVLLAGLIVGCATVISTGNSSVNSLDLEISGDEGKPYFLFDAQSRNQISRAFPRQGRLYFQLPTDFYIGQCVAVTDASGKPVLKDKKFIYLSARDEYQRLARQRGQLVAELNSLSNTDRNVRGQYDATFSRLKANRALVNNSCSLPPQAKFPPKPTVRCGGRQECTQDGAAICFTRHLGQKGCGMALRQFQIPGLLSSPGCAATAAALAGDKYDMGDAIVDVLHGMAEDKADELGKSDSLFDNLLGGLMAGVSDVVRMQEAKACTARFVERQFAPMDAWTADVARIRAEPGQLQASCQQDVATLTTLRQSIDSTAMRINDANARLKVLDAQMGRLAQERRTIEWCTG